MWSVKYDSDKTSNAPQIFKVGTHTFSGVPENIEIEDIHDSDKVHEGSKLTIKNVSENDAGKYICTIAIEKQKEVHFQVNVVDELETKETRTDAATSDAIKTSKFSAVVFLSTLLCAVVYRQWVSTKENIVTLVIRYLNFCEHHIPCGELSVEVNNFKGSKDSFPRLIKFWSKANE